MRKAILPVSALVASLALAAIVWASIARAHISLEQGGTHKSRYGDGAQMQKTGPCGVADGKRGENVYTYEPGQTITVKLVEYVPHPGYFRFAFDQDGDDDFKDPVSILPIDPARGCPAMVLNADMAPRDQCQKSDFYNTPAVLPDMDNLMPHNKVAAGSMYEFQVKLPDVECDNCTLQVIQVMEDPVHGPYNVEVAGQGDLDDIYHQCIDLVLKKGASASGTSTDSVMMGAAGSAAAGGSAGAKSSASATLSAEKKSDGCAVTNPGESSSRPYAWLVAMALGVLVVWSRRRLTIRSRNPL